MGPEKIYFDNPNYLVAVAPAKAANIGTLRETFVYMAIDNFMSIHDAPNGVFATESGDFETLNGEGFAREKWLFNKEIQKAKAGVTEQREAPVRLSLSSFWRLSARNYPERSDGSRCTTHSVLRFSNQFKILSLMFPIFLQACRQTVEYEFLTPKL